jgi:hypothetical protein
VVPEVRHGHGGAGGRSDRELALSDNGRLGGLRRVEERDAPFSGEPSTYDLHAARARQERELRVQVRKHGDEAMRAEPKVAVGGSDRKRSARDNSNGSNGGGAETKANSAK